MEKKIPNHSDMLAHLSDEDKTLFLKDLLSAIEQSEQDGNLHAVKTCIEEWEDTVELLSIPGLKDDAWSRFNKLKDAGLIN